MRGACRFPHSRHGRPAAALVTAVRYACTSKPASLGCASSSGGGHRVPGKVLAVAPISFFRSPEPLPGEPILRPLAGLYKTRISHLAGNSQGLSGPPRQHRGLAHVSRPGIRTPVPRLLADEQHLRIKLKRGQRASGAGAAAIAKLVRNHLHGGRDSADGALLHAKPEIPNKRMTQPAVFESADDAGTAARPARHIGQEARVEGLAAQRPGAHAER